MVSPHLTLTAEFELVTQALWTDPGDQSGWLYHRWLVGTGWFYTGMLMRRPIAPSTGTRNGPNIRTQPGRTGLKVYVTAKRSDPRVHECSGALPFFNCEAALHFRE